MHTNPQSGSARPVTLLAFLFVVTGCPSFATRGSARTMEAGQWEVSASLGATSANPLSGPSIQADGRDYTYSGDDAYSFWDVGVGVGVTDEVEVGGRLMVTGNDVFATSVARAVLPSALALDTKVQLARGDERGNGLDVAIDPTVTVGHGRGGGSRGLLSFVQVPVLLGLNLGERDQLMLSPQLTAAMPHLGLSTKQLIPSLGAAYLHRFESGWGVRPELTVIAPPDAEGRHFRHATFQASLGVLKK
ncbi:hypothetical protein [Myxococcus sp. RHSTA-1-4]|uniref:hypothetical protein n=1 Tax=Myxococcus sp. RHSTA-1-4 TaxID=2874601 RepID=UPI001CBC8769|nr:hypothetical protein [Myxococcus sp. RHSTA-1-4]MBZ4418966.1 hypothetical protein [Myxococcus sp. RHSTA-1-4]